MQTDSNSIFLCLVCAQRKPTNDQLNCAKLGFNLSSPRPAKTVPFVILLCLMPDDFTHQWRASGWESVNWAYLPILFLNLSSPRPAKTIPFQLFYCLTPANFTRQWRAFVMNCVVYITVVIFIITWSCRDTQTRWP